METTTSLQEINERAAESIKNLLCYTFSGKKLILRKKIFHQQKKLLKRIGVII